MAELFACGISYRTPAGNKRYFTDIVADVYDDGIENELCRRLINSDKYGRRRVHEVLCDFSATSLGMQIGS